MEEIQSFQMEENLSFLELKKDIQSAQDLKKGDYSVQGLKKKLSAQELTKED